MVARAVGLACNAVLDYSLDSVVYSWKPNLFTKKLLRLYQTSCAIDTALSRKAAGTTIRLSRRMMLVS